MTTLSLEKDLVFACPSCSRPLSADEKMVSMEVECPYCQHHFKIEVGAEKSSAPSRIEELEQIQQETENMERQLRENVTQTVELKGIMSRLNTELSRHQLRSERLQDRNAELTEALSLCRSRLQNI